MIQMTWTKKFVTEMRRKKESQNTMHDDKFHAQESKIAEGEKVLLKQQNENELPSNFEAEPCEIVSKKVNRVFKPNVTHVKKYSEPADDNVC